MNQVLYYLQSCVAPRGFAFLQLPAFQEAVDRVDVEPPRFGTVGEVIAPAPQPSAVASDGRPVDEVVEMLQYVLLHRVAGIEMLADLPMHLVPGPADLPVDMYRAAILPPHESAGALGTARS